MTQAEKVTDESGPGERGKRIGLDRPAHFLPQRFRLGDGKIARPLGNQPCRFLQPRDFRLQCIDLFAYRRLRGCGTRFLRNAVATVNDAERALSGALLVSHGPVS